MDIHPSPIRMLEWCYIMADHTGNSPHRMLGDVVFVYVNKRIFPCLFFVVFFSHWVIVYMIWGESLVLFSCIYAVPLLIYWCFNCDKVIWWSLEWFLRAFGWVSDLSVHMQHASKVDMALWPVCCYVLRSLLIWGCQGTWQRFVVIQYWGKKAIQQATVPVN